MPLNPLNPRIHLASRSPRRRQLLQQIGVRFDTIVFRQAPRFDPEVDETPLAGEKPAAYVERLARAKAHALAEAHPHAVVIASTSPAPNA